MKTFEITSEINECGYYNQMCEVIYSGDEFSKESKLLISAIIFAMCSQLNKDFLKKIKIKVFNFQFNIRIIVKLIDKNTGRKYDRFSSAHFRCHLDKNNNILYRFDTTEEKQIFLRKLKLKELYENT